MSWIKTFALAPIFRCLGKPPGLERLASHLIPMAGFPPDYCRVVTLDGFQVRVWPRSRIGWSLFCFGTYEPGLQRLFRRYVSAGSTVVEVGANVGWHTLMLSRLVGPGGRVHAFEPNPAIHRELRSNLGLNVCSNVTPWEVALSSEPGSAVFQAYGVADPHAGDSHIVRPACEAKRQGEERECVEVKVAALDTLPLDLKSLDFMKIDVEGF